MTNDVLEEFTTLESQVLDYDDPVTHHDDDAEEEAEEVKIWAGLDQKKSNSEIKCSKQVWCCRESMTEVHWKRNSAYVVLEGDQT